MRHPELIVQVVVRDETGREIGRRDAELRRSDVPTGRHEGAPKPR